MIIGGVDIGLAGGLAIIDEEREVMKSLRMPTRKVPYKNKTRKVIDPDEIMQFFDSMEPDVVYIESVSASPQMGVTSAFRFGEQFGMIRGLLKGASMEYKLVAPQTWKRDLGLSSDKSKSVELGCKLFPGSVELFKRKCNEGALEACLIAHYGIGREHSG